MLCLLERLPQTASTSGEVSDLKQHATSVSRQLGAWIDALKNSDISGTRYNNDQKKAAVEASTRRDAFLEELERVKESRPRASDGL